MRTVTPARQAPNPAGDFNHALNCANERDAFDSLMRAAESGCVRAQFLVGLAYHVGRGAPVDYGLARTWYRRAAGSGDGYAIANLGVMSLLGQGEPSGELEAYTWVRSAVGLGHVWLRPALDWLENWITGAVGTESCLVDGLLPEIPVLRTCTAAQCDPSCCNAV